VLAFGRDVLDDGGEEVGGGEDFEVAFGVPTAAGAVGDGLGGGVPMDFLEGEGRTEKILGEALAAFEVARADGGVIGMNMEAAVFPGEEVGELRLADEFGAVEGVEEASAEEVGQRGQILGGHAVEAAFGVEETVGGEDVEVGVEDEVVAKGVQGSCGGEAAFGQIEAGAEVIAQAIGGGLEDMGEESAALAEDAAQDFGDGEDELAVRDGVADMGGYPFGGLTGAALVTGGADVAGLAAEGEEALVAAVGAVVAGESGGEVATAVIGLDGGDGLRAEGTHGRAVMPLVTGEEVIPGVVNDLPERGGARAAGLVDGRHDCSLEQLWRRKVSRARNRILANAPTGRGTSAPRLHRCAVSSASSRARWSPRGLL